jgi:PAS domain S-box-containing protein
MSTKIKELKILEMPGIKLLLISSGLIFVFYAFLVAYNYISDENSGKAAMTAVEIEKLVGELNLHNESRTVAVKMYAITSNDIWEKNYSISFDKYEQSVKKVLELVAEEEKKRFTKKTAEAGEILLNMEAEAIKLVNSGNAPAADSLLTTFEYERNKTLYNAGLRDLGHTLQAQAQKNQRGLAFNKLFFNAVGALLFIIAISLAISAIRKTMKYLGIMFEEKAKDIEKSEREMKVIAEQQLAVNEQLYLAQKQVQEQNEKLKMAEEEAKNALGRQERTNQKLLVAQKELQKALIEQNRINMQLVEAQKLAERKAKELTDSERELRILAEAQMEINEKLLAAQKQEEKVKQELALNVQKQEVLNKILQKSILTNKDNLQEFFDYTVDTLGAVKFLELLPGIGIFTRKESDVFEMVSQRNISPKIQELCHNIKTGQCLCGLAIKMKETQYAHCVDERHTTRFEGIKEHGHYNVPIMHQGDALGALVVYLPHGHKKDQSEIDFLEAITNIIATTIVSVNIEKGLQEALDKAAQSEKEMRTLAEAQLETNEKLMITEKQLSLRLELEQKQRQELEKTKKQIERLSLVASKTDNAVIITDSNGLIEWVNDGFTAITEYTLEEVIGKKPGDFLQGKETNPADVRAIRMGLASKKAFYQEIYNYSKSGRGYWLGLNINPLLDENNSLTGFIAIESDITERKNAERELEEAFEQQKIINASLNLAQQELARRTAEIERSEKEMRALAEAQLEVNERLMLSERKIKEQTEKMKLAFRIAKSGAWALSANLDSSNSVISLSDEYFAILGTNIEQQEKYDFSLQEWMEKFVLAEDHPLVMECLLGLMQNPVYQTSLEVRLKHTEKGFIYSNTVINTEHKQGKIIGQGTAQDITERKQIEVEKEQRRKKLEKYNFILSELSTTSFDKFGSLEKAFQAITEAATDGLGIGRVSIWDYTGTSIICKDLFEFSKNQHSGGLELFAKDFPAYFEGIKSGSVINASNAHTHPNTFEFSEVYLKPLGINSMLDVPIRVVGELFGVICCEYVGEEYKQWSIEDENFARSLAEIISLMIEADKRRKAEEELKKAFERVRKSEEDMRTLAEAQLEANERLMLAEKQLKENLEIEKKQKEELDRLIAQLKDTQGQLVHNEKMASLGQLTAGIAHEINNPINFVYNGIDTLKISLDDLMEIVNKYNELDNANGNKDAVIEEAKKLKAQLDFEELTQDIEHLVSDIRKGAVRTMEIVKGLRVFSRLDEEERKMANIKDCLDSTLILLNNKMKGRVELKKYYDETMPDIMCYPGQLNQVFMNIINNAIQAIPEHRKDGVISIYTENQQENVIIRIKDNGIGMSEQVKRRIFEPFFTTKAVGVGTGLGLSITFGIIEKHNGQIFVNSEEGRGTEFVIQLPKEAI